MTGINDIKQLALKRGACEKVNGLADIRSAVDLLMTPQGREFAIKTGFPTLDIWRECAGCLDGMVDVLVDCGDAVVTDCDIVVVGESNVSVSLDGPSQLYHVVAMHGAKVSVRASGYAVVTVTAVNADVTIENDGTAIIRSEGI